MFHQLFECLDIDEFWVLFPSTFDSFSKWIDSLFKWHNISKIRNIDNSDVSDHVFDELLFFCATFDNKAFSIENMLFLNWNSYGERGMIQS